MKQSILFVDDEERILMSLKRIFRAGEYNINFVKSGKDGLEFLEKNPVSIIVSDLKMPEMNGVEFLERTMKICPEAVRIILSGYSEANKIMDAVNKGNIWHFISKPWNNDDLKMTIHNAAELYMQNQERRELTERLNEMNELLEKKVEERTWQLNERTRLLNMLLEDSDIATIIIQICSSISTILKGSKVFVKTTFQSELFSSIKGKKIEIPEPLLGVEKKALASGKSIFEKTNTVILLNKRDARLGTLLIEQAAENSRDAAESISGFVTLLDLALFQYKSIESAPELMANIDKLIGSI